MRKGAAVWCLQASVNTFFFFFLYPALVPQTKRGLKASTQAALSTLSSRVKKTKQKERTYCMYRNTVRCYPATFMFLWLDQRQENQEPRLRRSVRCDHFLVTLDGVHEGDKKWDVVRACDRRGWRSTWREDRRDHRLRLSLEQMRPWGQHIGGPPMALSASASCTRKTHRVPFWIVMHVASKKEKYKLERLLSMRVQCSQVEQFCYLKKKSFSDIKSEKKNRLARFVSHCKTDRFWHVHYKGEKCEKWGHV